MSIAGVNFFEKKPEVLVRAFRGFPARLRAVADLGGAVEVVGKDESRSLGMPYSEVYQFDYGLFQSLESAFNAGDGEQLESLWKKARGFREAEHAR